MTMNQTPEAERERALFEAAFAGKLDFHLITPDADYLYSETGYAWDGWQAARAIPQAAAEPVDWKLVPTKPTPEMLNALSVSPDLGTQGHIIRYSVDKLPAAYRAMLAAAPDRAPSTDSATAPKFDEAEFDAMVERGTEAWKGVPDDWLEKQRGNVDSATERDAGWFSVEGEQKPDLGEMVLLHVRTLMRGDMGDFGEVEGEGSEIALGEYRRGAYKDDPDYFECYTSPMSDSDWITHWMPLPKRPAIAAMKGEA